MRLVDADKIPWQTEKQRELRYNAMQQASQKIAEFQEISDAWDIWRNKRIDLEIKSLVETCAESLRAAKDELRARIEIRVTRVTVEARDPADQSRGYTVEIVKPENDVTRAASK